MADLATIARPYAEALVQLAKPSELDSWLEQLRALSQMANNPEVASLANNPNVSQEQLSQLLKAGVKGDIAEPVSKFVTLLTMNHRVSALPEIASQFEALKNNIEGAAEVNITSAFPMSDSDLQNLLAVLSKKFGGRSLRPVVSVDPELIGGVRVQVGDEVLDTSVKSRLEAMQAALTA